MRRFPGRTLDELDGMDWGRYSKVLEVERIVNLEAKLDQYGEGKIKGTDIDPDEWEEISAHEALLDRYGRE